MKILKQFAIILSIFFIGNSISSFFNLLIPGSVLGMIILFFLLSFKIIKVKHIKEISDFTLNNLAFFFIPAGVKILKSFELIKHNLIVLILIIIFTTIIVMIISGHTVQYIIRLKGDKNE